MFGDRIYIDCLTEEYLRVLLFAENASNGSRDFSRRKRPSGHLIEQRLEEMIIAAINQRDIDLSTFQSLRSVEAGKAASQNNELVTVRHGSSPSVETPVYGALCELVQRHTLL